MNAFVREDEKQPDDLLKITEEIERDQARSVQSVRETRDAAAVASALERLQAACRDPKDNLMPHLIDCVNAYCTEGEIVDAMAAVYGRYTEKVGILEPMSRHKHNLRCRTEIERYRDAPHAIRG